MAENYKQVLSQLIEAAKNGDPKAQYRLGVLYQDGKAVPKDYIQAVKYYTQAAAKGHEKAQLYLGLLYQNGRGIPKNYKQAAFLYNQAASQGNEKAMYYLGMLYYYGKGTEKNLDEAFKWLTEAATRGNLEAQKVIDEILNSSKNEISNDAPQDNSNEITNEFSDVKTNIEFPDVSVAAKIPEKNNDVNDLFRQALIENDEIENNPPKPKLNTKNKPVKKKSKLNKIIAFATLVLISAAVFMFFRTKEPVDFSNTDIIPLKNPVEMQNNEANINKPSNYNPDEEIFDIYSLAVNGNLSQLQNAVSSGANFNQVNEKGETPLHRAAAYNRHQDTVKFLISQGLDVNAETIKGTGYTPLIFAVIHNNTEAVRALLLSGAEVNFETPGMSVLSLAVKNDSPEIVNLLLNAKASPNIKDDKNKLPLDYANELPSNSVLKNSPVFEQLKAATTINDLPIIEAESDKVKSVQNAVKENQIPEYIFKNGKFSLNPYAEKFIITGSGVRFRTEPNTKSKIKTALHKGQVLEYFGEWVSPSGERWVLGFYKNNNHGYGWIYGQYTQLLSPNSEII